MASKRKKKKQNVLQRFFSGIFPDRKSWSGEPYYDYNLLACVILLVSFGLSYKKESPRIAYAVEAYPNRWTHHVIVEQAGEIDRELMKWLQEAYAFSLIK